MKFILIALFSLSAHATDLKDCHQFINDVLNPSVSFDEGAKDHGYRFVKNEKAALKFITAHDPSKLGIPDQIAKASNEMKDCKYLSDPKSKQEYCPNLFENYHYFQGLLYGMKNYKWSKSTVDLGKQKLMDSIKEITIPGMPLIHAAISYALLEDLAEKFPNEKITLNEVKQDRAELEKTIQTIQAEAKKKSQRCSDIQSGMKREREAAETYRQKLALIVSKK